MFKNAKESGKNGGEEKGAGESQPSAGEGYRCFLFNENKGLKQEFIDGIRFVISQLIAQREYTIGECQGEKTLGENLPAALIFTDNSAVPFGYAIREGLKVVLDAILPNNVEESLPRCLRINVKPHVFRFALSKEDENERTVLYREAVERWQKKIEKFGLENKKLAIFDEYYLKGSTIYKSSEILKAAGALPENIIILNGFLKDYPFWKLSPDDFDARSPVEIKTGKRNGQEVLRGETGVVFGFSEEGQSKIQQARNLIHDMELLGQEAGRQFLRERRVQNTSKAKM
ncbi:MAG: hypothetical protein M1127_00915 [Patescibacteria group bacterium]|nr:hypothetical protein [Patescibacteria group bacterium]